VIRPAMREEFRCWLGQFGRKQAAFAMEGTSGWRFVVEELEAAKMEAHLAEPAETRARRGPKRRAKTDRADARLLRDLLLVNPPHRAHIPPTLPTSVIGAPSGSRSFVRGALHHDPTVARGTNAPARPSAVTSLKKETQRLSGLDGGLRYR